VRDAPVARRRSLGRHHRRPHRPRRTVGGSLRDKFEIPGSDTQKATDLIESKFASEQGAVLNLVFAAPPGSGSTRPRARRRSRRRRAAQDARVQADAGKAGSRASATRSADDTFSKNGRIAYAEAQFDQTIEDADRDQVVAVEDAVRQGGRAGRRDGRVQRRGRVPADRAGHVRRRSACSRR
jgi:RND superfamily putative drug exporter